MNCANGAKPTPNRQVNIIESAYISGRCVRVICGHKYLHNMKAYDYEKV